MACVLITGASRGIGRGLAEAYAARGDDVLAAVRDAKADTPKGCRLLPLDVTDAESVAVAAARLVGTPIDLLINNAGLYGARGQALADVDMDDFARVLDVNVLGPQRVTQAFLPNLRRANAAKIAVISSAMGQLSSPQAGALIYRTSKAAVNKLAQGWAEELRSQGIAVACLHPGWVQTDMGGSSADIPVSQAVPGIIAVLDQLSVASTGRFWNYTGKELSW
jgi:NAD(P)-dependent dehydrogenase (short-subunit alcohol dehydrogenase family)